MLKKWSGAGADMMISEGLSFRHKDWSHLHKLRFDDTTALLWPSFASMTDMIGILVVITGYKTIAHARQGNYAAHRTWARFHTYAGFAIPVQRACQGLLFAVAMLIPLLPKSILQRFNYPSSDEAIHKAELGSQAPCSALSWYGADLFSRFFFKLHSAGGRKQPQTRQRQCRAGSTGNRFLMLLKRV
ncbi:hypothetical protein L1887_44341 [Cichorium endivia]|nr:hypothetical protein L1887_44341 [Cichorium endivia]